MPGLMLGVLQSELRQGGQWLPIDPPFPEQLTIADLLARNLSGPRRFGYGTIRDYVIGMKVRLTDGRTIKGGGRVVKNVAGYDLQKLFIGADHSLGQIVEATFKLRPLPSADQFVQKSCPSLKEAGSAIEPVLDSPLVPIVLDLHNVKTKDFVVVLGFDGESEDVAWQAAKAAELGFCEPATLNYEQSFWATQPDAIKKLSVLPSRLIEFIPPGEFVARAGNGIVCSRALPPPAADNLPVHLFERVRQAFNPAA